MAKIALECGADGVFLINHGQMDDSQIPKIADVLWDTFPNLWIGVNYLSMDCTNAVRSIPLEIQGLWTDYSEVDERLDSNQLQPEPEKFVEIRRTREWQGIYFGGTAFKYQRTVRDLETAARYASRYMDVVTTSGMGTGIAADVEKIRRMKTTLRTDGFDDYPLAVASGITPENVGNYLPFADAFLVSSGICKNDGRGEDFFLFDPEKVRRLAEKIKA